VGELDEGRKIERLLNTLRTNVDNYEASLQALIGTINFFVLCDSTLPQ